MRCLYNADYSSVKPNSLPSFVDCNSGKPQNDIPLPSFVIILPSTTPMALPLTWPPQYLPLVVLLQYLMDGLLLNCAVFFFRSGQVGLFVYSVIYCLALLTGSLFNIVVYRTALGPECVRRPNVSNKKRRKTIKPHQLRSVIWHGGNALHCPRIEIISIHGERCNILVRSFQLSLKICCCINP